MSGSNRAGIGNEWDEILKAEFEAEYFENLRDFLRKEYKYKTIYPPKGDVCNALKLTPPDKVRAVILGQDPYINPGEAHGLAFSVGHGVRIPPSLGNIYKELNEDTGIDIPKTGNLTPWAEQGVLLLNTVLTVEAGKSNSHAQKGWEKFTDYIIGYLGEKNNFDNRIVFMLWGRNAQSKAGLITNPGHLILKAPHPSPLSAHMGFFGCRHFSKANKFLSDNGLEIINWGDEKHDPQDD